MPCTRSLCPLIVTALPPTPFTSSSFPNTSFPNTSFPNPATTMIGITEENDVGCPLTTILTTMTTGEEVLVALLHALRRPTPTPLYTVTVLSRTSGTSHQTCTRHHPSPLQLTVVSAAAVASATPTPAATEDETAAEVREAFTTSNGTTATATRSNSIHTNSTRTNNSTNSSSSIYTNSIRTNSNAG